IIALAVLLFFLKKRPLSLMIVLSYALSGIFVQIIKYFYNSARPGKLLEGMDYHNFVEGVTLHTLNSFPSGHTTSAFALAAILGFAVKNKNYSISFLLIAAMVGYSRIYLGQHFMVDVLAGSVIGVLSAIIVEMLFRKWSGKLFQKNNKYF
ncbi:MAG: phosphatase PAP2 family protein, partial [Ginsengibacter sp.]